MPRQIDLFPRNLQVNYNPNNQLGVTADQINSLQAQIPEALEKAQLAFINSVLEAIDQATGWDLASFIQKAQAGMPLTGNLAADLWNFIFGANNTAQIANTLATQVNTDLQDFLQTGNWSDLTAAITGILQLLFGTSSTSSMWGSVPSTAVTNVTQSLQPFGDFPTAASMAAGGGWSYDPTVTYTDPVTKVVSKGSAKFTCSGVLGAMRGVPAAVQPGQVVAPAAVVKWAGLSAGANAVQLQLVPWTGTSTPQTAGTPITVAQLTPSGASSDWQILSGTYTVPSTGVGFVQVRLVVTALATVGTIWWSAVTAKVTGGFLSILQDDLNDLQNDAAATNQAWQTFWSSIQTAITNDAGNIPKFWVDAQAAWNTLSTTLTSLEGAEVATLQQMVLSFLGFDTTAGQLPPGQVQGVGGLQSIVDTFNTWLAQLGAALNGDVPDAGPDLAWLAQLMNDIYTLLGHTSSQTTSNANYLAVRNNKPLTYGLDPTTEANIPFSSATKASTNLIGPTSQIMFVRCAQTDAKGTIAFIGQRVSGTSPTVNVNVFKYDSVGGNLVYIGTSVLAAASIGASLSWYFVSAAGANVVPGDTLAIEYQNTSTVNGFNLYGTTEFSTTPIHPSAALPAMAATRSAGTTAPTGNVAISTLTFTNAFVAYTGLETSNPPPPVFFPQTTTITASQNYTIQSWSNFIDLVGVGAGGGGGGTLGISNGAGGTAGLWGQSSAGYGITLTVGTSGPTGIASGGTISVTVGAGGNPGPAFTYGYDATATVFTWLDSVGATQTFRCAGGLGGKPANNTSTWGLSPGNVTYPPNSGNLYVGGALNAIGGPGNAPGGGGPGGGGSGYQGASGQAWVVDRQT